jgi:trk system potassium uptake protein TrkH
MKDGSDRNNLLIAVVLLLGVVSLFIEFSRLQSLTVRYITNTIDYVILLLFILEVVNGFVRTKRKIDYFRQHIPEIVFLFVFLLLFIFSKYMGYVMKARDIASMGKYVIILRNVFILVKIGGRIRSINSLLRRIATHPAQAVLFSFVAVIIVGTLLVMLPYATTDNTGLGFVNALFTATSAVCVTGLIVVDTATRFTMLGKSVILFLIQIGGLGIMVLSYFMMSLFRRKLTLERTLIASYMLDESDLTSLHGDLRSIISTTLIIEFIGFVLLIIAFARVFSFHRTTIYVSLFHSVSAFCNAGFSLFSNNLEAYKGNLLINVIIAVLIILGGFGFSVLQNMYKVIEDRLQRLFGNKEKRRLSFTLNSKVVLLVSVSLIVSGMLMIYAFEHNNSILQLPLHTQYLTAFFQSVTLRTAGFNTIDFTSLHRFTYLFMILFMFIGGASGSTAGGVKVNTIAVIGGYVHGIIKNRDEVTLFNHSIAGDLINRAFFILLLYGILIFTGTLVLTMTEQFESMPILFEVVSATGTVGLSTGITSSLTTTGKLVIILLMFIGRVGPLTIFIALSQRKKKYPVTHPTGHIAIG